VLHEQDGTGCRRVGQWQLALLSLALATATWLCWICVFAYAVVMVFGGQSSAAMAGYGAVRDSMPSAASLCQDRSTISG